ncbi:MAG: response regulator [Lachnospiraceae bacterium]|nr:response regulator [Lachnospiraceae bacterium]
MRDTILIADDAQEVRMQLSEMLYGKHTVASVSNGREAMEYLQAHHKEVALLMLDMHMPVIDGRALLKVLKLKGITKRIPVIMLIDNEDIGYVEECYNNGASEVLLKPFLPAIVISRINNVLEVYRSKAKLEDIINTQTAQIQEKNRELEAFNDRLTEVMSSIVEFRNLESSSHIKKIKGMSRMIAETITKIYPDDYTITPEQVDVIASASALHDIGMIAIPDSVLLKPGKLTPDEFEVVKSHTTLGCEILRQIEELQSPEYIKISYNICRYHHERFDGSGYPEHLKGENIPVEAQIVGLADSYDSLISERTYRDAFDMKKAYSMIMNGEAGAFSERLLDCFSRSQTLIENYCKQYSG